MAMNSRLDSRVGIRLTRDDKKIISALKKRLGVDTTQIVRLGLRALATKEGLSA